MRSKRKIEFANILAGEESAMMNNCERYGMTWDVI